MGDRSGDEADRASDEIWKPGYSGPVPVSLPTRDFDRAGADRVDRRDRTGGSPSDSARPPWRAAGVVSIAAVVGLAAVGVMVVGVTAWSGADQPLGSTADLDASPGSSSTATDFVADVAGADPTRLPTEPTRRWSREIQSGAEDVVTADVVGDRYVLLTTRGASVAPADTPTVEAVDARSGATQWMLDVSSASLDFVGALDDIAVFVAADEMLGVDLVSGDVVWRSDETAEVGAAAVDMLEGTPFLAVERATGVSGVVEVATGATVGRLLGPRIGTDHQGRWYVRRRGADVVEYDLGSGFRELTVIAADVAEPVVAIIGDRLLASGPDGWRTFTTGAPDASEDPVADDDTIPTRAAAITPTGDGGVVVTGVGSVVGGRFDGATLNSDWTRVGIATTVHPTVRGSLVLVSVDGGATQRLIDGTTGDVVDDLTMLPGVLDSLVLTGNGVLTRKASADGRRLAAIDLDGSEMWALGDVASAAVGDGVVVTSAVGDGVTTIEAFTDPV